MKCFVIAMNKEAEGIISAMNVKREQTICGKKLYFGELYGEKIGVIICGVGKVNAAMGTQIAIDVGADIIINIGVAGGLTQDMRVADVYSISHAVQYDFDLTCINQTPIGTLDECKTNYIPLTPSSAYPSKKIATADRFNDDIRDFLLLTKTLKADIRDMECGAVAQVCMHANVKCYAFKIISDLAGKQSTPKQYAQNLDSCFVTLKNQLENILKSVK